SMDSTFFDEYPTSEKGINPKEKPPYFCNGIPMATWPKAKSAVWSLALSLDSWVKLPYIPASKTVRFNPEYEAGLAMFKVGRPVRYLTPVEIPPIARVCGNKSFRICPRPNCE